jgi:hypothetical protein
MEDSIAEITEIEKIGKIEKLGEMGRLRPGEAKFYKIFALVSILLFMFLLLDLSLSYIPVYNTANGQCTFQPVIKFIPMLG